MGTIKSKLSQAGIILAVMGIMSIVLSIFNYNIRLLAWVDMWGDTMGWVIRISLIVGGGILFLALRGSDEQ